MNFSKSDLTNITLRLEAYDLPIDGTFAMNTPYGVLISMVDRENREKEIAHFSSATGLMALRHGRHIHVELDDNPNEKELKLHLPKGTQSVSIIPISVDF